MKDEKQKPVGPYIFRSAMIFSAAYLVAHDVPGLWICCCCLALKSYLDNL